MLLFPLFLPAEWIPE